MSYPAGHRGHDKKSLQQSESFKQPSFGTLNGYLVHLRIELRSRRRTFMGGCAEILWRCLRSPIASTVSAPQLHIMGAALQRN